MGKLSSTRGRRLRYSLEANIPMIIATARSNRAHPVLFKNIIPLINAIPTAISPNPPPNAYATIIEKIVPTKDASQIYTPEPGEIEFRA